MFAVTRADDGCAGYFALIMLPYVVAYVCVFGRHKMFLSSYFATGTMTKLFFIDTRFFGDTQSFYKVFLIILFGFLISIFDMPIASLYF